MVSAPQAIVCTVRISIQVDETSSHHLNLTHHVMVLMLQLVAMENAGPGVAGESCYDAYLLTWMNGNRVLPA